MQEKRYVKAFDTLKGLAVLIAVTIGHYWQFTPAGYYTDGSNVRWVEFTNKINQLSFSKSYTLMELLMMISGFQMLVYYERINSDKISFGEYFRKRASRLIPAAAISSVIMFIGVAVYVKQFGEYWHNTAPTPGHLMENLFLIQSWVNTNHTLNGPLWYVSVYFFCTIFFYFLARINKRHGGLFFMALPIICGIGLFGGKSSWFLLNGDMCRGYIAFFMGVLAAMLCEKLTNTQLCLYSLISFIAFALIYVYDSYLFYSGDLLNRVLPTLILLYAPLLMIFTRFRIVDNIIGNPGISWLGKISYELCALNFPFYIWVEIMDKKFGWNLPYGKVPMYYIQVVVQVLLAVGIHFLAKAIRKAISAKTAAKAA